MVVFCAMVKVRRKKEGRGNRKLIFGG